MRAALLVAFCIPAFAPGAQRLHSSLTTIQQEGRTAVNKTMATLFGEQHLQATIHRAETSWVHGQPGN
jgi:uncharacterized phage protein gp47/JayE